MSQESLVIVSNACADEVRQKIEEEELECRLVDAPDGALFVFSDEADGSIEARVREIRQQALEKVREKLNKPGSGKPTLEEFKQMVYEDRERRKLKNRIKRVFGKK